MKVAVCDYRAGNIRSVEIALRRLGAELVEDVAGADLAVLPGVGSARSAMDGAAAPGPRPGAAGRGSRTGAPCSGSASASSSRSSSREEDGGVEGLGILPGRSVRIEAERVPRMGWAEVDGTAYYFAHSYAAETPCGDRRGQRGSSPRRARARSSVCSSIRRRAVPRARATSTGCWRR